MRSSTKKIERKEKHYFVFECLICGEKLFHASDLQEHQTITAHSLTIEETYLPDYTRAVKL